MNGKKDEKDLMEAIRFLLRTTEELKASICPLIRDQEDVFKIFKLHDEAITRLMKRLIGTEKEHKKRLESLELLGPRMSSVEEKQLTHESLAEQFGKRLRRVEFQPIDQIIDRLDDNKKVSTGDLKVIEEILSLHPEDVYILVTKARVLNRLGRKQKALESIDETISKHPRNPWPWFYRGLFLEDFDEILKSFDKSLELLKGGSPISQHFVLFSRASLLGKAKRFKEALDSATKSVEFNPKCDGGWLLKGIILAELEQIPQALGCFEKAIELNCDSHDAWFQKGLMMSALEPTQTDEAIACFDKAIKLDPQLPEAYFNKGKLLVDKKQYEKALQSFDKGLEIDNRQSCAWCSRGIVLNRMKQDEKALKSFEKALELGSPNDCYLIFRNVEIVLNNLGRRKEIIEMFEKPFKEPKILEKMPADLLNTYAYMLYEHTKRYKEGSTIAGKAVDAEPQNAMFWDTLACNLQALGNDGEAFEAFKKALSSKKNDKEITWDALAKLYEKMGRAKEAEQAYQKFKSIEKESKQDNSVKE